MNYSFQNQMKSLPIRTKYRMIVEEKNIYKKSSSIRQQSYTISLIV